MHSGHISRYGMRFSRRSMHFIYMHFVTNNLAIDHLAQNDRGINDYDDGIIQS